MKKYPNIKDIQNKIKKNKIAQLSFYAEETNDIIHPYSISGYEYLSAEFVDFLDSFKSIIPAKAPIVLKITGKEFDDKEKDVIDQAIWRHYGLYLSEASKALKSITIRMIVYFLLMILSSVLLFLVDNSINEVVINYAYVVFWFFAYRLLIHLVLDCQPIYKEYKWYRRLSSLKLIFADDNQTLNADAIAKEELQYEKDADILIKNHGFVEKEIINKPFISIGCKIKSIDDAILPCGINNMEIVSQEMADYISGVLPFVKQSSITRLEIEGNGFSQSEQDRISKAIRNYLAFEIFEQESEQKLNSGTSVFFALCLIVVTLILYACGKNINLAIHEFILVAFWFFADYLLEFVILSRMKINRQKKAIEKLANMDIIFK